MKYTQPVDYLEWYLENDSCMTTDEKREYLENIIACSVSLGKIETTNQHLEDITMRI